MNRKYKNSFNKDNIDRMFSEPNDTGSIRMLSIHPQMGIKMILECDSELEEIFCDEIRSVLDDLISRKPKDWEEFLRLLAEEGYEIKRGKNIAIKSRAQQRFVRLKSLGEDYTEEAIKEKISRANVRDSHRPTPQPGIDLLIDIQNRALGKGAGYERWAKGFNMKQTAKTLLFLQQHNIHSYKDLERMTNEAVTGADQLLASIKEKDARIKEIEALWQHIFDYSKTRKIYLEYKRLPKAKKAEFYEMHRAEIELQEAARSAFDQLPEGTKLPTVKELNAERTRLIQERQSEYAEYRKVKADRTEFIRAKQNADVILNRQEAERADQDRTK